MKINEINFRVFDQNNNTMWYFNSEDEQKAIEFLRTEHPEIPDKDLEFFQNGIWVYVS